MAEEFAEFMDDLNRKPEKDQLTELKDVVVSLVNLVQKLIDGYTTELEIIHKKINSLETKNIALKTKSIVIPNIDIDIDTLTPPAPPIKKEGVRKALIGELKFMFDERKKANGDNHGNTR